MSAKLVLFWRLSGRVHHFAFSSSESLSSFFGSWPFISLPLLPLLHPHMAFFMICFSVIKTLWLHPIIQDNILISKSLAWTYLQQFLKPYKETLQIPGIRTWTSLGRHYSTYHNLSPWNNMNKGNWVVVMGRDKEMNVSQALTIHQALGQLGHRMNRHCLSLWGLHPIQEMDTPQLICTQTTVGSGWH